MSVERSLLLISRKTVRTSSILSSSLKSSFALERLFEKKSLDLRKKLVEERKLTLRALESRYLQEAASNQGGLPSLLGILGLGGASRLLRGRRGGGGGLLRGFRGRPPIRPSSKIVPFRRGLGGVRPRGPGVLGTVLTGVDFLARKSEGQTNLQAGAGAVSTTAGAIVGSSLGLKIGATVGTFIAPGVGTAIGAGLGWVAGGFIGGFGGGALSDRLTGADKRRQFEEQRFAALSAKTQFSHSLDILDRVLDKLEANSPFIMLSKFGKGKEEDDDPVVGFGFRRPWQDNPIVRTIGWGSLFAGALTLFGLSVASPFEGAAGDVASGSALAAIARKTPLIKKIWPFLTRTFRSKPASEQIIDVTPISVEIIRKQAPNFIRLNVSKFVRWSRTIRDLLFERAQNAEAARRVNEAMDDTNALAEIGRRYGLGDSIKKMLRRTTRDMTAPKKRYVTGDGKVNLGKTGGSFSIIDRILKIKRELWKQFLPKPKDTKLLSPGPKADLGNIQSSDIASAGTSDTVVINNAGDIAYVPQVTREIGNSRVGSNTNDFSAVTKYAQVTSLLTV